MHFDVNHLPLNFRCSKFLAAVPQITVCDVFWNVCTGKRNHINTRNGKKMEMSVCKKEVIFQWGRGKERGWCSGRRSKRRRETDTASWEVWCVGVTGRTARQERRRPTDAFRNVARPCDTRLQSAEWAFLALNLETFWHAPAALD